MKNILPLTVLLVFAAGTASASPINCADQSVTGVGGNTLDKYIALGASGCLINNVLFANFAYSYTLGTDAFYVSGPVGTGAPQAASVVTVAVSALNEQFQFGGNWVVNHYQTGTLSLSYTVLAPSSNPANQIQSLFVSTQGGSQNGGPISTTSALCAGGTCGPTNFTNSTVPITPTIGPLTITNSVFMNSNSSTAASTNNYHLSIITNQYAQTAPPGVPEPGTWLLVGAGIGLAGFLKKRRAA